MILSSLTLLLAQFCGKVLHCIDVGGEGSALIAAGGSDPILRIWDPRKPGWTPLTLSLSQAHLYIFTLPVLYCFIGTSAPVFQFSSHSSWISACKWHNKSWFHLITASYDGKVMLWDLRTAVCIILSFGYSLIPYKCCIICACFSVAVASSCH